MEVGIFKLNIGKQSAFVDKSSIFLLKEDKRWMSWEENSKFETQFSTANNETKFSVANDELRIMNAEVLQQFN